MPVYFLRGVRHTLTCPQDGVRVYSSHSFASNMLSLQDQVLKYRLMLLIESLALTELSLIFCT